MDNMYGIIERLCAERGIKIGKLCAELKISRGVIGDLKAGRTKQLSATNMGKIADYFDVTTDFLLGKEQKETPTQEGERSVSDDELMFGLWGDSDEVDRDDLEDVKRYAAFVRERKKGREK